MIEYRKLNILMCCYLPLKTTLGGSKGYLDVAQNYRMLGHNVDLVGIDEVVGSEQPYYDEDWRIRNAPLFLKDYLLKHGDRYDVAEYESLYLPFDLSKKVKCILVARCSLLDLHFNEIAIPRFAGFRSLIGLLVKGPNRRKKLILRIEQSLNTLKCAELINAQNPTDRDVLIKYGIQKEKIIVQPLAIFQEKLERFSKAMTTKKLSTGKKTIAFVGTFDNRKGAVEFPLIVKEMINRFSEVEFKLLGVIGMFPDEESIIRHIGEKYRDKVKIIGKFSQEELPELLRDCTCGVFPSYLESFGYGVLEMMAMGLPVVGYNSPGINMLILSDLLAEQGDVDQIVENLSKLITNEDFYNECVLNCKVRVDQFIFEKQENFSIKRYQEIIQDRG